MTNTPTPAPAPMTAEDLRVLGMKFAGGALTIPETADLFRHIDALTARVAHWQSVHQTAAEANERLRAELAAARKVDDAEVVEAVDWLLDRAECSSVTLDPSPMGPIAGLLTRLSAALKEAEAKLETIRRALFPDPEHHITHHARYNLEGALADLEAGQNDPTVRRTLKRVAGQIAAAERALQTKDTTE